jgi:putative PIN family toxin of toxin-antitoxin system
MRVVVQDASVLIDLGAAELLDAWFSLEIETLTTSLVWREVNRRTPKAKLRQFARDDRIHVVAVGAEALSEVVRLKMDLPRQLTLNDASVLHLAVARKAVLLTGDQTLRKCAESRAVPVHGLLWLLDHMVAEEALSPGTAARKLELLCRLNPRLPKGECEALLAAWRMA